MKTDDDDDYIANQIVLCWLENWEFQMYNENDYNFNVLCYCRL